MANTKKKKMQQLKRKRSLAERVASHVICWKRTPTPNNLRHYPSRATTSPPPPKPPLLEVSRKGASRTDRL